MTLVIHMVTWIICSTKCAPTIYQTDQIYLIRYCSPENKMKCKNYLVVKDAVGYNFDVLILLVANSGKDVLMRYLNKGHFGHLGLVVYAGKEKTYVWYDGKYDLPLQYHILCSFISMNSCLTCLYLLNFIISSYMLHAWECIKKQ